MRAGACGPCGSRPPASGASSPPGAGRPAARTPRMPTTRTQLPGAVRHDDIPLPRLLQQRVQRRPGRACGTGSPHGPRSAPPPEVAASNNHSTCIVRGAGRRSRVGIAPAARTPSANPGCRASPPLFAPDPSIHSTRCPRHPRHRPTSPPHHALAAPATRAASSPPPANATPPAAAAPAPGRTPRP